MIGLDVLPGIVTLLTLQQLKQVVTDAFSIPVLQFNCDEQDMDFVSHQFFECCFFIRACFLKEIVKAGLLKINVSSISQN